MKAKTAAVGNSSRQSVVHLSVKNLAAYCFCLLPLLLASCGQLEKPKTEPFYAQTAPPQKKEFRWSNGKMPKSFDPALASVPPETDLVRAVFEGLTDTDSKTLQTVPAMAIEWKSSEDFKTWTFILRKDARWSNGERVTAKDFARSWKRLAAMGDRVAHRELLRNIVGVKSAATAEDNPLRLEEEDAEIFSGLVANQENPAQNDQTDSNSAAAATAAAPQTLPSPIAAAPTEQKNTSEKPPEPKFGVEASDNFTLVVSLVKPDKDFPALVAHPIFRPVFGDGKDFEANKLNAAVVTNGAFRITSVGAADGITLDRAENYWNRAAVELERVRLVPMESAEKALQAYRAGEIDAVTNAAFEPLALKLLTPYKDFRRTPYSAVNFYEFNRRMPPFDDRRVREALAIAIERERITEDEMDGASLPALSFLPFEKIGETKLAQDAGSAKNLLAASRFPNGENFPIVKLLINRNNLQQRIARSVARMWKQNLNVETEIVVKDASELESAWATGEYALVRRGAVFPTANETANMSAIFPAQADSQNRHAATDAPPETENAPNGENPNADSSVSPAEQPSAENRIEAVGGENPAAIAEAEKTITTEEQAFTEMPAIPLYFPTSYSLVKPYIQGFHLNILDAPSLKEVRIDNNWQPKTAKSES